MKKSVLALSVAAAIGGVASAPAAAQSSDRLVFNPAGVGHILIVPYFSTQSGNATLLNLYNTDTVKGKAVKIRFRGASNSDDLYDFQVFLSPGDVWTADVRQASSGKSRLATSDRSCTVPANINGEFITSRLDQSLSAAALADETREGYVEILNMGDIPSVSGTTTLWYATKHATSGTAAGTAPCTRSILDNLSISDPRLDAPTTGLMANWTIINVPNTTVWSGEGPAIEARSSTGTPIAGANVYWPQQARAVTVSPISTRTADPLFVGGYIEPQEYDLPDLSTPYIPGACAANCAHVQANALSASMAVTVVAGEYLSSPTIGASTDWVISKPTRRYYVAVDYEGETAADRLVTNYDDNSQPLAYYYREANTFMGSTIGAGKPFQACTQLTGASWFDREEQQPAPGGPVVSPGPREEAPYLCGEVSVVGVNSPTSPLGASLARVNVTLPTGFRDGWGSVTALNTFGSVNLGLPMLVTQFSKATNPQVSAGVSGTFGAAYTARTLKRGTVP